ncbi:MAG: EscU/YscU/HrcU family type III secretion system export apparatus switch protein [Kordiimonadaceae bacterium]|nr:EscU/YscU/HrcU family type III secretion system export apparatus switch protein [Kordiimonadaceae bacterium]
MTDPDTTHKATSNKTGDPTKAVAIKRDGAASIPRVTAKGEGALAEKILDIAFAKGVKVRQDKDLTELLDAFEVESPVPLEALHAVSLILERVYAENNRMRDNQTDTTAANAVNSQSDTEITTKTDDD